jgi:hypothetical protein
VGIASMPRAERRHLAKIEQLRERQRRRDCLFYGACGR